MDSLSIHDLGIDLVCAFVVMPGETVEFGWIPRRSMYCVLHALSQEGRYEVFATEDGGKVVGHLAPTSEWASSE